MAGHLSRIYGTEQDKFNCPFYFKMGACRHGDRCSRRHNKPTESQTVMIRNMYQSPFVQYSQYGEPMFDVKEAEKHFEDFWEDVFVEVSKCGEVEEINVCSNNGEHLRGNVYVKFYDEDDSAKALAAVNGRFYNGQMLRAELSPVTDFSEAKCRQYRDGSCNRAGNCNFMHVREPPRMLAKKMFRWQTSELKKKGLPSQRESASSSGGAGGGRGGEREKSRSRSRDRHRRSRSRSRDRRSYSRRSRSRSPRDHSSRRDYRRSSRSPDPKRPRRDDGSDYYRNAPPAPHHSHSDVPPPPPPSGSPTPPMGLPPVGPGGYPY